MQGGFLGAFADSAMGAAAVTFVQGRKVFAANAEMKISFLAPVPTGAILTCTAEVVSGGSTAAFVEASVWSRAPGAGPAAGPGARGGAGAGAGVGAGDGAAAGARDGAAAGARDGGGEVAAGPEHGRLVARANSTYLFRPRNPD